MSVKGNLRRETMKHAVILGMQSTWFHAVGVCVLVAMLLWLWASWFVQNFALKDLERFMPWHRLSRLNTTY
jgi:hypothetical protein